MSKPTLTRRQKWRIEKIQAQRIARANKAANKTENHSGARLNATTSAAPLSGQVITRYGQHTLVEDDLGQYYQCTGRQNIALSVAGDRVIFQPISQDEGVITALLPRINTLNRSGKIIASNVDQLWLMVAIEPHYQFELIDRYLVMAQNTGLPINIIVNKIELATDQNQLKHDLAMYQTIGYEVHYLSVQSRLNLDKFKDALKAKTHIFLGQSGVGKSSLINALMPALNLRVNALSLKTKLGKHTTTNTTLYHIPTGGDLIDSPGIRMFQLSSLSALEILRGFIEFAPHLGGCQFRNCAHINEPNCAIKAAVKSGSIHPKRYQSYLNLIANPE